MPLKHYTGSWYPEGFFGSSFDALRRETNIQFRTEAKPNPPYLFLRRLAEPTHKHVFSEHDNRRLLEKDGSHLDRTAGRRRRSNRPSSAATTFRSFRWTKDEDGEQASLTTYQVVYNNTGAVDMNKRISEFLPNLGLTAGSLKSSYRESYQAPEASKATENNQPKLQTSSNSASRRIRPQTSQPRLTVADCLIWKPFSPPEKKQIELSGGHVTVG
ncbi:unnamed protein product [Echinostoma caproni]|uniref:HDNR domain-containing protein n=1 Tax=Echinostoma caproni TaxID=27848 RepID=A0A183AE27_9TREM|nr:unnamed protein product [Echinostoma caproni]